MLKILERIEQAGKRLHLLLYGIEEKENDSQYTEWRSDLEASIYELVDANKAQVREELIEDMKKCVPEEKLSYNDYSAPEIIIMATPKEHIAYGFNSCCQEMLKNLEELK